MGILDIARIHMVVLALLSIGLLISISWFEKAWNDVQRSRGGVSLNEARKAGKEEEKTDWCRLLFQENYEIFIFIKLEYKVRSVEWRRICNLQQPRKAT